MFLNKIWENILHLKIILLQRNDNATKKQGMTGSDWEWEDFLEGTSKASLKQETNDSLNP